MIYIDDPLRLGEKIEVTDICPSCNSLHVTKTHCESCGLQFDLDIIGEPFGVRSFFTLKDDFDAILSKLDVLQFKLSPSKFSEKVEVKRYVRHMLKRYNDLIEFLTDLQLDEIPHHGQDRIRLFLYEAKEIMKEYSLYTKDLSALYIPLKHTKEDAISREIKLNLYSLDQQVRTSREKGSIVVSQNWELLKNGIFFEALAVIGAVILASFFIMKFLVS